MQINGYEVEIKSGGVQVGCTFIPIEKMRELVKEVENKKSTRDLKSLMRTIAEALEK